MYIAVLFLMHFIRFKYISNAKEINEKAIDHGTAETFDTVIKLK
jgi:hypothetical protein